MKEVAANTRRSVKGEVALAIAIVALAALRLCHIHVLWSDEDYHLAAALQILDGKLPYRDFWYDKPPLSALYYMLIAGHPGWPLRLLDTTYVLAACFLVYKLGRAWWGICEARTAALLLAFSLAFYLPGAVVGFAADALMILPHLAAIFYALTGRAALAGLWGAIAFLVNVKGLFCACCMRVVAARLSRLPWTRVHASPGRLRGRGPSFGHLARLLGAGLALGMGVCRAISGQQAAMERRRPLTALDGFSHRASRRRDLQPYELET